MRRPNSMLSLFNIRPGKGRSEVARGIISILSQHLRARVHDLNELRARLEALER